MRHAVPQLRMHRSMCNSATSLSSCGFLVGLFLLLLNDLVLKWVAGGFITGKLSDFAGLFVFPLFWSALFPRHRVLIHCMTAAGFVWWKLPLSAPWIDFVNSWSPASIGRIEDLTDLVALSAIVASYWFSAGPRPHVPLPPPRWVVIPIALFAFSATTFLSVQRYDRTYAFRAAPSEIQRSLSALGIMEWVPADSLLRVPPAVDGVGDLLVRIPTASGGTVGAYLSVAPDTVGAAVTLRRIDYGSPPARHDSIYMISLFEQCVVQRLDSLLSGGRSMRPSSVRSPPGRGERSEWCRR